MAGLSICEYCSINTVLKSRGSNATPKDAECPVHNPKRKFFPRSDGKASSDPYARYIRRK